MKKRILVDEFSVQDLDDLLILKFKVKHHKKTSTRILLDDEVVVDDLGEQQFYDSFQLDLGLCRSLVGKTLFFMVESCLGKKNDKTSLSLELAAGSQVLKINLNSIFPTSQTIVEYEGRIRILKE